MKTTKDKTKGKWTQESFQGKSQRNYETSATIILWCSILTAVISISAIFFKIFF